MKWFKLYSEFAEDPKLRTFTKAQRYDLICLMCYASEANVRGTLVLENEDLAATLGITEEEWIEFRDKLVRKCILTVEDGKVTFTHWDIRQDVCFSDKPEQTRERKRMQRAREKASEGALDTMSDPYVEEETPLNNDEVYEEPRMSRHVTNCHDTDKIRLEEIRSEEIRSEEKREFKKEFIRDAPGGAKPTVLLNTFVKPSVQEVREYFSYLKYDSDADAFFDYWECWGWRDKQRPVQDWRAAVRNWERLSRQHFNGGKPNPVPAADHAKAPEVLFKPYTPSVRQMPEAWVKKGASVQ